MTTGLDVQTSIVHDAIVRSMGQRRLSPKRYFAVCEGGDIFSVEMAWEGKAPHNHLRYDAGKARTRFVAKSKTGFPQRFELEVLENMRTLYPRLRLRIAEHDDEMNVQVYEIVRQ